MIPRDSLRSREPGISARNEDRIIKKDNHLNNSKRQDSYYKNVRNPQLGIKARDINQGIFFELIKKDIIYCKNAGVFLPRIVKRDVLHRNYSLC